MSETTATILADSEAEGVRLVTMLIRFPRIILAELNTHRVFSRNVASSRAVSVERRIADVVEHPFIPAAFGGNQRGMQAGAPVAGQEAARAVYLDALTAATDAAQQLAALNVHKQWANRLIEPFSYTTAVVSSTEWDNFFRLRCSELAQPEMRELAEAMRAAMEGSTPRVCSLGDWHIPWEEAGPERVKRAVARIARVSYERGSSDVAADVALHDRLRNDRHMSPFEHIAQVANAPTYLEHAWKGAQCGYCGISPRRDFDQPCRPAFIRNFRSPWRQYRDMVER